MARELSAKQLAGAVLLLLIVGWLGYRWLGRSPSNLDLMPDTAEYAQTFICAECGHQFQVTPRQRAKLLRQVAKQRTEPLHRSDPLVLPCPACGKLAARVGVECPRCGQPFLRIDKEGRRHKMCPACEQRAGLALGAPETPKDHPRKRDAQPKPGSTD